MALCQNDINKKIKICQIGTNRFRLRGRALMYLAIYYALSQPKAQSGRPGICSERFYGTPPHTRACARVGLYISQLLTIKHKNALK